MERYAWKATVKEGMLEEYTRRHNEIWPELVAVLKQAGIANYTIWNTGNELFGYYECEKGADYAARIQAESEVVDRWNAYMQDVMVMEMDPVTGAQPKMGLRIPPGIDILLVYQSSKNTFWFPKTGRLPICRRPPRCGMRENFSSGFTLPARPGAP